MRLRVTTASSFPTMDPGRSGKVSRISLHLDVEGVIHGALGEAARQRDLLELRWQPSQRFHVSRHSYERKTRRTWKVIVCKTHQLRRSIVDSGLTRLSSCLHRYRSLSGQRLVSSTHIATPWCTVKDHLQGFPASWVPEAEKIRILNLPRLVWRLYGGCGAMFYTYGYHQAR